MDGENNGSKPYEQMDDLGFFPIFLETPIYTLRSLTWSKKITPKICKVVFQAPFCQTSRVPGTLNNHINNQYDSWKPQGIPFFFFGPWTGALKCCIRPPFQDPRDPGSSEESQESQMALKGVSLLVASKMRSIDQVCSKKSCLWPSKTHQFIQLKN